MALTKDQHRTYNRQWMRQARQAMRTAQAQVTQAVTSTLPASVLVPTVADLVPQVPQEALRLLLTKHKLPLGLTLETVRRLHGAKRPYGKDAIMGPDNDARARACELAIKLHERAGTLPQSAPEAPSGRAGRVRLLQIDPDGTERVIEIG